MTTGTAEVPATEQAPASAGQELAIDTKEVGTKNLGTRKVVGLKEKHERIWWVKFEGIKNPVLCWKESKAFPPIKEGDERELTIEVSKPKNGGANEIWVKSYGSGGFKGGGGGGGFKGAPKDDASIAAQVVLKEACECARAASLQKNKEFDLEQVKQFAAVFTQAYMDAYSKIKAVATN